MLPLDRTMTRPQPALAGRVGVGSWCDRAAASESSWISWRDVGQAAGRAGTRRGFVAATSASRPRRRDGCRATVAWLAASRSRPGRRPRRRTDRGPSGAARSSRPRRRRPPRDSPASPPTGPPPPRLRRSAATAPSAGRAAGLPDGRAAFARRCHSTIAGWNPPIAGERRSLFDEPEEDRGAGGEVGSHDRDGARRRARPRCRPVRLPARRRGAEAAAAGGDAGLDVARDRPCARCVDDRCRLRRANPDRDAPPAGRRARRTVRREPRVRRRSARPSGPHQERSWSSMVPPRVPGASGASGGRPSEDEEGAVTCGVRGPWSLPARRSACLLRAVRPLGPCLPAGPPELLLRLVGHEDAAHVHILH